MSKINIGRAVHNILPRTNSYTPLVEVVVNAIDAIDEVCREGDGKVEIRVLRSIQSEVEDDLPEIDGFEIRDNGIGFTEMHRESFDTLYTDQKLSKGGRGFGRFVCLKHFSDFKIESVFKADDGKFMSRRFSVGRENEIIEAEEIDETQRKETGSTVRLRGVRQNTSFGRKLDTIAKVLVQRLLLFLVGEGAVCPEIVLSEQYGDQTIILNHYLDFIEEIDGGRRIFELPKAAPEEEFRVRTFKIYEPKNLTSQIGFVAHKREVSETPLKKHIPEFEEAFYEGSGRERKYIIKAYVFGDYLDRHVSVERGGFKFSSKPELYAPIGKDDIERHVAEIARDVIGNDFEDRKAKKRRHVQEHVDSKAPWLKNVLSQSDLTKLRWNAAPDEIEGFLHEKKLVQERDIRKQVDEVLSRARLDTVDTSVTEIVGRVSENSKDDLVRYIAFRRSILELFEKSLEKDENDKYLTEGAVHDIIFPRRRDTESIPFDDHNLWIVDERLNFAGYVSSDKPLGGGNLDRPDLLIYDNRVLFGGENVETNPITVFEFKRPMLEDFVGRGSPDDPIEQIIGYVSDIRDGKCENSAGRPIKVAENTPAYGYVVCDLTPKIEDWLRKKKGFTPMSDGLGWFDWAKGIKLYIEVVSWEKVLKDAEMRNRIFFKKLGIEWSNH